MEKSDKFDERRAICQSFPFQSFPVNTFPMKATINLSKFCSSKFLTCSIHQISSDFSTVKVLCYTVFRYHNSDPNFTVGSDIIKSCTIVYHIEGNLGRGICQSFFSQNILILNNMFLYNSPSLQPTKVSLNTVSKYATISLAIKCTSSKV